MGELVSDRRSNDRLGLADVVSLLRQDISQVRSDLAGDIKESEQRVSVQIEDARTSFLAYQSDHVGVHNRRKEDTDRIHEDLGKRLDAMTVIEARRAGSLAVILLVIRTLGTHWQLLIGLAAILGLSIGHIDITVGTTP